MLDAHSANPSEDVRDAQPGLGRSRAAPQVSPGAVRRARWEALLLVPLFVGVVVLYENRRSLLGLTRTAKDSSPGWKRRWTSSP